ncbi:MAG: hypothetical protein HUN04_17040 [Desulfobacter sp.]|nr:MAG: hypothetical protein HUN04_17040 [Desulfobacter sp.]
MDGEAGRIRTYGGLNPNLIRVENKITSHVFSAFTLNPSIQLDGWKSLKSIDHIVVGYRLGITGTEAVLPRLINGDNLSPVTNTYLGLRMLIKRRIDVYVDGEAAVRHWLQTDEFQDAGIKKAGEMAKVTIHCYLHKKHMELVPKLSNMIGELRKKNLIKKYYWKAVRETESTDTGQENPLGLPPTL